jgi:hypothetical protein
MHARGSAEISDFRQKALSLLACRERVSRRLWPVHGSSPVNVAGDPCAKREQCLSSGSARSTRYWKPGKERRYLAFGRVKNAGIDKRQGLSSPRSVNFTILASPFDGARASMPPASAPHDPMKNAGIDRTATSSQCDSPELQKTVPGRRLMASERACPQRQPPAQPGATSLPILRASPVLESEKPKVGFLSFGRVKNAGIDKQ